MKITKTASGKKTIKISKKEWTSIGKKAGWIKKAEKFIVVDNPFNQANYPDLIGKIYDNPPSYAAVEPLEEKGVSIFDFVDQWKDSGYGIALVDSATDIVVDPYVDPSDYPNLVFTESKDGASSSVDGKYYIKFHSGVLEEDPNYLNNMHKTTANSQKRKTKTAKTLCDECDAHTVNGTLVHERGCPSAWKSYDRECKWCGTDFKPKDKDQKCCSKSCEKSYNS